MGLLNLTGMPELVRPVRLARLSRLAGLLMPPSLAMEVKH